MIFKNFLRKKIFITKEEKVINLLKSKKYNIKDVSYDEIEVAMVCFTVIPALVKEGLIINISKEDFELMESFYKKLKQSLTI